MKIVLTTLNSKYIHSNLAIRMIANYAKDINPIEIVEFTINQNIDYIVSQLYKLNPDILGFSTYIWNLEETLKICETLKIINPKIRILLGGPEVSFEIKELMDSYSFIDYIIYGEGEETFREFIKAYNYGKDLKEIDGLVYREKNQVIINSPRPLIKDLNSIPSPYKEISDEYKNKIVYYESSRGCPFNCEFCLSSTIKGVRYFPIERVKEDISNLIDSEVRQVKFVDRTFNANKKYALEIMQFIMEKDPEDINFHFEVTAHLIDDEMLEFLKTPKEGLFQFEIGVQSTNEKTIATIGRTTDFKKLKEVCQKIKLYNNIHQHLDLIAGLPYEGYSSFRDSFNDVYSIRPEKIQLGFLKLLKGSGLKKDKEKYGFKYLNRPPYEVLENNYISYNEMIRLKAVEDLVEKYYNEGYFTNSLEFIVNNFYKSPFDFYEDLSKYWSDKGYDKISHSRKSLYEKLNNFYLEYNFDYKDLFNEILKFDYIKNNNSINLPNGIKRSSIVLQQSTIHDLLKDKRILKDYLPEYQGLPTKRFMNNIIVEPFSYNIFEVKNNGFDPSINKSKRYILFNFKSGKLIRCKTFDITSILKELI